ncbi:hypothetical protein [Nonomuraea sp. NPDC005650]|uniref:hypothetical protein n=1 Tax=Nonomuraea sp. NPDC005650 TaxID=3157045 RepID=UPI0033AC9A8D
MLDHGWVSRERPILTWDHPPDIGEVTYWVFWDGDDRYRRSSASVMVTVRHRSTLTLDGPQSGVVGTAMELTGVLTA